MKVDNEQINLWDHAIIKILDVRHIEMNHSKIPKQSRVPASMFLFSIRGSAQVRLDETEYLLTGFQLLHSGKGAVLTIAPSNEKFEYYLIYYRAILPEENRQKWQVALKQNNPFQAQYRFTPSEPLFLFNKIQGMDKKWQKQEALERFNVKALFYQFVHHIFQELHRQDTEVKQPNISAQIITYIQESYAEPITLDTLAEAFNYSAYHLSSLFKEHTGYSPIDYLIRIRLETASELLITTDVSVREIAASIGYKDVYYFSRIFKKRKGVSPAQFRARAIQQLKVAESPVNFPTYSIVEKLVNQYISNDNHYQLNGEGDLQMNKMTKAQMMATLLFCFSLLLTACSSGTSTVQEEQNNGNDQSKNEAAEESMKVRIVSTPRGDVEVPAEPKRVAADQYMGHLLKLGIIPIGVRTFMLDEGWMEKANIPSNILEQIEDLGNFPMNLEKLTLLEPDLIVGSIEEHIEQYEKVGTTVFLPYWEGLSTAGPLDKFRNVSKIFGKEKEAEEWITEYEQQVTAAKSKVAGIIKEEETVSIVSFSDKAVYVLAAEGGNYGSSTIYEMLELPPTESAINMSEGFEAISLELLPQYLGDHIFVYNGDLESTSKAMESEVWKSIPAVKNDRVYLYGDSYHDEFVMEDPYSLEIQLETIVNLLLDSKK